jgi:hypothetical protein
MNNVKMSQKDKLLEWIKCAEDPIYYGEKYCTVPSGGIEVQYKAFDTQKRLIKALDEHEYNVVLKYRQAGVSTTTALYVAAHLAFAPEGAKRRVLVVANKGELAKEFYQKVLHFLYCAPEWMDLMNPKKILKNANRLKLANGNEIKALGTSKDVFRGYSPTFFIMDEAAFIDKGEEVLNGGMPSIIASKGKICLISTPNGMDKLYYKTYADALAGKNNFNIVDLRWWQDPRYIVNKQNKKDLVWQKDGQEVIEYDYEKQIALFKNKWKPTSSEYRKVLKNMDPRMVAQEFDCNFLGSSNTFIDESVIHEQNLNTRDPIRTEGRNGEIWIFEDFIEGHNYIMGCDVASGNQGSDTDSSTMVMLDLNTGNQVLEFKGKVPADMFALIIKEYADKYNALTAIDSAGGWGEACISKLLDMNFKHMYYAPPKNKAILAAMRTYNKGAGDNIKSPGINTGAYRSLILAELEKQLREEQVKIRSSRLIEELRTFVIKDGGRPDHMDGYHDDLLFALGIAIYVGETGFKQLHNYNRHTRAMIAAVSNESSYMDKNDFMTKNNRVDTYDSERVKQSRVERGENEDMWSTQKKEMPSTKYIPNSQYDWLFGKK